METSADMVIHPPHYNSHPSGLECWDVIGPLPFCVGNAIKYLWRAGQKHDSTCPLLLEAILGAGCVGDIIRIHNRTLPCETCRTQDHLKAANYLRAEAERCSTASAQRVYHHAVGESKPLIGIVIHGCKAQPEYSALVTILSLVLLRDVGALIEGAQALESVPGVR